MTIWHRIRYAPAMKAADLRAMLIDEAVRAGCAGLCGPMDQDTIDLKTIIPPLIRTLDRVRADWTVVEFSPENVTVVGERTTTGDVPYVVMLAGGIRETPVACVMYFDGQELRGYVPKDGNSYNLMTKSAFGNFKDDFAACGRQFRIEIAGPEDMLAIKPDMALVELDVSTWIEARGKCAYQGVSNTAEMINRPA